MATFLQKVAGKTGRALDTIGTALRLPEMGWSERAFSGPTQRTGYAPTSVEAGYRPPNIEVMGPRRPAGYTIPSTSGSILGASTSRITGGGGTPGEQAPAGNAGLEQNINRETEDLGAILDRDYESAIGALAGQEQGLRGQAGASEESIKAGYGPARTAVQEQQAGKVAGLAQEETTAKAQEKSALQQARDLFRQIQQENIAQLSGAGISSSSVAEALAERLGVETARRISGVTGSTQEIVQNIAQERTRTNQFYQQKLSDLEREMGARMGEVQQSLMQGLNQINTARQLAATDKANRRAELLSNAQTQIAQLQANSQNFQQALQQWQAQRTSTLNEANQFVIKPTDFSGLQSAISQVGTLPSVSGFVPVPQITQSGQGYRVTPSYQKKPTQEEDAYTQALRNAGITQ